MSSRKQQKRKAAVAPDVSTKRSDSTMRKVTIQVQKPDPKVDPIIVSFPGGVPSKPPSFQWRQLHARSAAGRTVEGLDEDGSCVYRASSQGIGYDERRTKLCVGIYDKKKGVVTLHQAASKGTVYALQQYLPAYKEELDESGLPENKSLQLFTDFGSAKKRKVLKSQQANRVNVDTVIGAGKAMVDSMLGDDEAAKMSESNRKAVARARQNAADGNNEAPTLAAVEDAHEALRRSTLPPFNAQAEKIFDVYDFHLLLGKAGWTAICKIIDACLHSEQDFVQAVTRGKPNAEGIVPPPEKRGWALSVLDCLRNANNSGRVDEAMKESRQNAKTNSSAIHQLRCIILLHYLIRFYKRFHNRPHGVFGIPDGDFKWFGIPRSAALAFFHAFAIENGLGRSGVAIDKKQAAEPNRQVFIMPNANREKCLVHVFLVYLLARGGPNKMMVDDLTLLLDDLEVEGKVASRLYRFAGCTVKQTNKTKAFLTVPVTFPKPSHRGGKVKKNY